MGLGRRGGGEELKGGSRVVRTWLGGGRVGYSGRKSTPIDCSVSLWVHQSHEGTLNTRMIHGLNLQRIVELLHKAILTVIT